MDQKTFEELKKQAKINIIGKKIKETKFRLTRPLAMSDFNFDCHYKLGEYGEKLRVTSTSTSPLPIETVGFGFSSIALSKALKVLFENRDLASVNLPCNIQLGLQQEQDLDVQLYDVQLTISIQTIEFKKDEKSSELDNVPVAMVSFYTENGDSYFINAELPSLIAHIVNLEGK